MSGVGTVSSPGVDSFLVWMALERGRAQNTLVAYERDLRRYVEWLGARDRTEFTAETADLVAFVGYLNSLGLAPASVARSVVVVRALHGYLASEGLTATDPSSRLESPRRPTGLPKALSEAQIERLFAELRAETPIDLRDRALLEVLYGAGLRISEAVGLSMSDVDLDGQLLRAFGKGAKERIVPLGRCAATAFAEWFDDGRPRLRPKRWTSRDDAQAVFLNARGGRLTRQGGWLVLSRYAQRAGLADVVTPHVLRHSCATHMLDHGADIRAVQEMLGHASISTTQLYTKVMTDRLWAVYGVSHPRANRSATV